MTGAEATHVAKPADALHVIPSFLGDCHSK
jgi:hypothetical protein